MTVIGKRNKLKLNKQAAKKDNLYNQLINKKWKLGVQNQHNDGPTLTVSSVLCKAKKLLPS